VEPETLFEYAVGSERRRGDWLDYVQGTTAVLREAGHRVGGFDAWITSGVPLGSGLSSSAALEVALLRALRSAFDLELDDLELARLGRRAENSFVGAQVGIMDQMAACFADETAALFIDTRTLEYRRVPLPAEAEIAVVDSGVAHDHARGDYNTRRAECERACQALGVPELRDVGAEDLERVDRLPDPLNRRARHVITENARVLAAVAAMEAGQLDRLGSLLTASHASMRVDYEVSVPAVDLLVELAESEPSVYGARLTGGGFGGSIVMLVRTESATSVARRVAAAYGERSGHQATVLVPTV
jgi:galactokinase